MSHWYWEAMWFFRFRIPLNSFLHFWHLNVLSTACPIHARIGVRNVSNSCAVRTNICAVCVKMVQNKRGVVIHIERKHRAGPARPLCRVWKIHHWFENACYHRAQAVGLTSSNYCVLSNIVTEKKYQIETTVFDLTQTSNHLYILL